MTLSPHEAALISRIKDQQDNAALIELINLHTGIYYAIASKYSRIYPDVIKLDDLTDDRMTNIYRWIIAYKADKDTQLSTYIGDRTDYMCRDILKREKRNPLSAGVGSSPFDVADSSSGGAVGDAFDEGDGHTASGKEVRLTDQSISARPADEANANVGLADIVAAIRDPKLGVDPRFATIVEYRHFTSPPLSWRAIGAKLSLSYEICRRIYHRDIAKVRAKVGGSW